MMIRRLARYLLITGVLLFFVLPASAKEFTAEYRTEVLDNGATVVCRYMPDSSLVTVQIRVLSGLSNEGKYAGSGISHFLEHLLFKGTRDKTSAEISRSIKLMGGMVNGSTGLDSAEYHITVPKENFRQALDLLADIVMDAEFTDDDLETEREVILKEIKLYNDDPTTKRIRLLFSEAYTENVYRHQVIGDETRFKQLTREDVMDYHAAAYTPDRVVIGVAGGVPPDEAIGFTRGKFSGYARPSAKWEPEVVPEPPQGVERKVDVPADAIVGYLAMAFHTTDLYSPDLYPGDVLSILLGEGNDSRLYTRLVKEKRLLYDVSCVNYTPRYPGLFFITAIGDPSRLEEAREEIFSVIEELKLGKIEEREIERARNMSLADYLHSHERVESVASSMTSSQILTGDPAFFEKYLREVRKVEAKDIKRMLLKYLVRDNSSTVFLLPRYLAEEEGSQEKVKVEVKAEIKEKGKREKQKAREIRKAAGTRRGSISIQAPPMEEKFVQLDNGMKIIVKRKGYLPLVSVTLAVPGGLRAETKENNGISELCASLALKGTKTRDESEIVPEVERMGGVIGSFSGLNSLGLTLDIMSDDLSEGLDIFEDVARNAVFPEAEIEKQKEKAVAVIQEEEKDIFQNGMNNLRRLLYGSHPYGMRVSGEFGTVSALSRDEIMDFYSERFSPSNAVLTVVGDLDPSGTAADLSKRFGGWSGKDNPLADEPVVPLEEDRRRDMAMKKEQALFIMGFQGLAVTDGRKYALSLAGSLLSGSDGLLFMAAREDEGITYASGAINVPEVDPGYFVLYVATTEDNVARAETIASGVLEKITSGEIDAEEVQASKNRLIVQRAFSLETNRALSMIMALDELYGLTYRDHENFSARVGSVSKEDIVECARDIFGENKSAIVVIHSEP